MGHSNRSRLRAWVLCGAAALTAPAFAADRPADDAGARIIMDFVQAYAGKAALPSIAVTKDGSSYIVEIDLAAATAALKPVGFSYEPAKLKLRVFQQDDGQWRIQLDDMPPIAGHMTRDGRTTDSRVETTNLQHVTVIDPKLNWIASSRGGADKMALTQRGPGIEQYLEFSKIKFDAATTSGAQGLTTTVSEPIGSLNIVMDVDPNKADPAMKAKGKPVHVSAQGDSGELGLSIANFQPAPILDAWRFFVAHQTRADLARDAAALKSTVAALVADHFNFAESVSLAKLAFDTQAGPVAVEGATFGASAVNAGPDSGFSEHVAAASIKLPDGLLPSIYAPVVPTSFDISVKASGFDVAAASQEWLARAKLDGDGPILTGADKDAVRDKLVRSKPIVVDIAPSHIKGPSLDIAFQGKVTVDMSQPTGAVTVTVADFDKTAQAVQGMGPQAEQKLVPVIAMVKGLGKAGPDGAMVWELALGRDHVMKVNGLPLGKAPF